jgi:hypothetical protein
LHEQCWQVACISFHNLRIACSNRMQQSHAAIAMSQLGNTFRPSNFDTSFVFRLRVPTIGILIPGSRLTLTALTPQVRFPCRSSHFACRKSNPSRVAPTARCVFTLRRSFAPCG